MNTDSNDRENLKFDLELVTASKIMLEELVETYGERNKELGEALELINEAEEVGTRLNKLVDGLDFDSDDLDDMREIVTLHKKLIDLGVQTQEKIDGIGEKIKNRLKDD